MTLDGPGFPGLRAGPLRDMAERSSTGAVMTAESERRLVLNVGCGNPRRNRLKELFPPSAWQEVRLDLDPKVQPDLVASTTDLSCLADRRMDAVWSSHNLEHLHDHEVGVALRELVRILRSDGFCVITTPDIVRVAAVIAAGRLEEPLYISPAGPVTPLDVMFGLRRSVAAGNGFMAHRTAFSAERLGRLLVEAGFAEARVWQGDAYDLWAVGLMPDAKGDAIAAALDPAAAVARQSAA
ncbi:class I SAM-dependent methyltransferase [Alsobacter sp. R-9]